MLITTSHHDPQARSLRAEKLTDEHDLVDFVSDDRLRAGPDGRRFTRQRWSTPIGGHRAVGRWRAGAHGEARWHAPAPEGEFTYLEYHLDGIAYNVGRAAPASRPPDHHRRHIYPNQRLK